MRINFALYDYLVRKRERTKAGDAGMAGANAGEVIDSYIQSFLKYGTNNEC